MQLGGYILRCAFKPIARRAKQTRDNGRRPSSRDTNEPNEQMRGNDALPCPERSSIDSIMSQGAILSKSELDT
jgi:hypothetical protein